MMKPRNMFRISIGALMTVSGLIVTLMSQGEAIAGTILLCAGLAFLITGVVRQRKYGDDPESDERLVHMACPMPGSPDFSS
jgi:hypothetical protein